MVRNSVLPRKANAVMRAGPKMGWKSPERLKPVPSSPNQIQRSHLQTVIQPGDESTSVVLLFNHISASRNPVKHHMAKDVMSVKSLIMA